MKHSNRVQVAIAGLGRSGWGIHANALEKLSDMYGVVSVYDPDAGRCHEAVQRFRCRVMDSFEALAQDHEAQLLVVATPNRLHAAHALAALEAGRHVVCEKPLAMNTAEADHMLATADRQHRLLAPFQNKRHTPDFDKVREIIDSGVLGRIVQIRMATHVFARRWDWQTLREFGGGELNNMGAHLIDQALQLFGPSEPELFCHADRALSSGDAEDHVKVILRATGAPLVEVEISRSCAYGQDTWLVMATRGGLHGNQDRLEWKYTSLDQMPDRPVQRGAAADRLYNRETLTWVEEHWQCPPQTTNANLALRFYEDLYRTLRQDAPLKITPQSVRRQINVLERCQAMIAASAG